VSDIPKRAYARFQYTEETADLSIVSPALFSDDVNRQKVLKVAVGDSGVNAGEPLPRHEKLMSLLIGVISRSININMQDA